MHFNTLPLGAIILPLLSSVFGVFVPGKHCAGTEGLNPNIRWWSELEIPPTLQNKPDYRSVKLVKNLAREDVTFEMTALDGGLATVHIEQPKGFNQLYRVNFEEQNGGKIKSFIVRSNSGLCRGDLGNVLATKIGHITVEMARFS